MLLARFLRDAREAEVSIDVGLPEVAGDSSCVVAGDSALALNGRVFFEDLDFCPDPTKRDVATSWATALGELLFPQPDRLSDVDYWRRQLAQRLCVVHDDAMSFLSRYATEVVTRNVLKHATKTVDNLWDEENLPAETVLSGLMLASPNIPAKKKWGDVMSPDAMFTHLGGHLELPIQFGGKATVGRGRCRVLLSGGPQ